MYLVSKWFLMEINFCRPRVIHGLFLNFNFCLESFFRVAYIFKIELNLVRKLIKYWSTFPLTDLSKFSQSTDKESKIDFFWSNLDQSLSRIFNFVDDGLEKKPGAIRNWGKWSDIVAVRLPNILYGVITFG